MASLQGQVLLLTALAACHFPLGAPEADVAGEGGQGNDGTCPGGAGPTGCQANAASHPSLKWRGFPYKVTNPRFARTVYGGGFIKDTFKAEGFEGPMEGEDWDVLWTHKPQSASLDSMALPARPGRRLVNHCNYFAAAGDKCRLTRLTNSVAGKLDSEAALNLPTFELDNKKQLEQWKRLVLERPEQHWLLKPCLGGASQGIVIQKGQSLLDAQERFGRHAVAQEYVERPYMGFGGRKFHLRLYIVVTRWSPVSAYLYDEGLVFRSAHEHRGGGARSGERDAFSSISKSVEALPLARLWEALDDSQKLGANTAQVVQDRIASLLRALLGAEMGESFGSFEELERRRAYSCFDLLGADVLLDEALRPAVMEFNIGPNMWVDNHGAEHKDRLLATKQPLVTQVVRWAALRVAASSTPQDHSEAEAIERRTLRNFSRLL